MHPRLAEQGEDVGAADVEGRGREAAVQRRGRREGEFPVGQ
ncbi:hypothetical protein AB0D78_33795 [Streptomyces avermitilis]